MKSLVQIALDIYLGHTDEKTFDGWELRKGKVTEDINKAVKKGIKMGNHKLEQEVDWIALYLKNVLKKKRTTAS